MVTSWMDNGCNIPPLVSGLALNHQRHGMNYGELVREWESRRTFKRWDNKQQSAVRHSTNGLGRQHRKSKGWKNKDPYRLDTLKTYLCRILNNCESRRKLPKLIKHSVAQLGKRIDPFNKVFLLYNRPTSSIRDYRIMCKP